MLVRRRVQVLRSLGSMSRRVQTLAVRASAWAWVKALEILGVWLEMCGFVVEFEKLT